MKIKGEPRLCRKGKNRNISMATLDRSILPKETDFRKMAKFFYLSLVSRREKACAMSGRAEELLIPLETNDAPMC